MCITFVKILVLNYQLLSVSYLGLHCPRYMCTFNALYLIIFTNYLLWAPTQGCLVGPLFFFVRNKIKNKNSVDKDKIDYSNKKCLVLHIFTFCSSDLKLFQI